MPIVSISGSTVPSFRLSSEFETLSHSEYRGPLRVAEYSLNIVYIWPSLLGFIVPQLVFCGINCHPVKTRLLETCSTSHFVSPPSNSQIPFNLLVDLIFGLKHSGCCWRDWLLRERREMTCLPGMLIFYTKGLIKSFSSSIFLLKDSCLSNFSLKKFYLFVFL